MLKELLVPLDQAHNIDPSIIPIPNYSHISKNIKVSKPQWIEFDNMHIDDDGNVARD